MVKVAAAAVVAAAVVTGCNTGPDRTRQACSDVFRASARAAATLEAVRHHRPPDPAAAGRVIHQLRAALDEPGLPLAARHAGHNLANDLERATAAAGGHGFAADTREGEDLDAALADLKFTDEACAAAAR